MRKEEGGLKAPKSKFDMAIIPLQISTRSYAMTPQKNKDYPWINRKNSIYSLRKLKMESNVTEMKRILLNK
jgi:hypothetical protein